MINEELVAELADDALLVLHHVLSHMIHPTDGTKIGEGFSVIARQIHHREFFNALAWRLVHECLTLPRFPELGEVD